jgi:hypothetical protein
MMMMMQAEKKENVAKSLPRMAVARLVGHDGPIPVARFTGKSKSSSTDGTISLSIHLSIDCAWCLLF